MKQLCLLSMLAVLSAGAGSAALIDFTTTSSVLSCGTAANCAPGAGNVINFSLGGSSPATLQITYSANIEADLNATPAATTNFGQFFLLCVSCAGQTGSFDLTGSTLALNVTQGPDPFAAAGTFGTGDLSGTLTLNNGAFGGLAQVAWVAPATFSLSSGPMTVSYTLQQPSPPVPPAYFLSIGAATTLQGFINTTLEEEPIPEPTTCALIGAGLLGLGLLRRR